MNVITSMIAAWSKLLGKEGPIMPAPPTPAQVMRAAQSPFSSAIFYLHATHYKIAPQQGSVIFKEGSHRECGIDDELNLTFHSLINNNYGRPYHSDDFLQRKALNSLVDYLLVIQTGKASLVASVEIDPLSRTLVDLYSGVTCHEELAGLNTFSCTLTSKTINKLFPHQSRQAYDKIMRLHYLRRCANPF